MRVLLFFITMLLIYDVNAQSNMDNDVFIVKPYLQVGRNPSNTTLELEWQANETTDSWMVEKKNANETAWSKMPQPQQVPMALKGIKSHIIYKCLLSSLIPGSNFQYRVSKNNSIIFSAEAKAPKEGNQPYRSVIFGDIGAGTPEAKKMALRAYLSKPDIIVVPGDIVYEHGLISEYQTMFWPVYNRDEADTLGAPLMRSIPFLAAPGNHDAETRDLDRYPDALAYYLVWDQPLNGPLAKEGSALVPLLNGSESVKKAFFETAGDAYPRMTNFSYNYGNTHWTILDADPYVDWNDSSLQKWVENDLANAKNASWRFVVFHHPGFNSSREHYEQQQMRLLSPVFEKGMVDVVFNGHVHNYQRSYPLHFVPDGKGALLVGGRDQKTIRGRVVNGKWTLDKTFNGITATNPNGVIYIVTGAGGQELYNPEQSNDPDSWQRFTCRFISTIHSLTVADVTDRKLTITQIGADGKELDKFIITK